VISHRKIKNPVLSGFIVLSVSIVIVIFASRVLYTQTVELLTNNLRQRILTISITAAANIDSNDLAALQTETDWQKPEWARVTTRLNKVKYSNEDIVFMYIFRKKANDPNAMQFVADADSIDPYANDSADSTRFVDVNRDGLIEPDGPDKLQWPGQDYPEAVDISEAFEAYDSPLTSRELYTDAYGTVLTGYAPIKDDSGNTVAVLATDIKADDFFTITRQTLQPFLIFIVFLTAVIFILEIIIIYSWKKYAGSLEELNTQIEVANEKLKELDQLKSEFLSLATHQIRSPLTAIKGYASLMLEGDYGALSPRVKEPVDVIMKSTENLITIVGEFLDISRIEQGRMIYNKEKFDMCALVKETAKNILPNIEKAGIKLIDKIKPGSTCIAYGDKNKIQQIIGNLLDNSIKYTPKDEKDAFIEISIDEVDDKVRVCVRDGGIGIDPAEVGKLFNKFVRTKDAHKTNVTGTGLGLYIAKKMMEAQGGTISVSSQGQGKGSTFYIELPKS